MGILTAFALCAGPWAARGKPAEMIAAVEFTRESEAAFNAAPSPGPAQPTAKGPVKTGRKTSGHSRRSKHRHAASTARTAIRPIKSSPWMLDQIRTWWNRHFGRHHAKSHNHKPKA